MLSEKIRKLSLSKLRANEGEYCVRSYSGNMGQGVITEEMSGKTSNIVIQP